MGLNRVVPLNLQDIKRTQCCVTDGKISKTSKIPIQNCRGALPSRCLGMQGGLGQTQARQNDPE